MSKKIYPKGSLMWKIGPNTSSKGLILGRITFSRRLVIGTKFQIVCLDELCDEKDYEDYEGEAIKIIQTGVYKKIFICGIKPQTSHNILKNNYDDSIEFYGEYYARENDDINNPMQLNFEPVGL